MSRAGVELARRVSSIQQSYIRLWAAFSDAANWQGLRVDALDSRGAAVTDKNGIGTAVASFLLKQWPFKAVSDKRKVDIVVSVQETFSGDRTKVVRATTSVAYLLRKETERASNPLLELHYDFETPVQEAHPLFHAQLGATDWSAEHLKKLGFEGQLVRPAQKHDYASARIPTAFMGFGPILVMLAADHLNPRGYRHMVGVLKTIEQGYVDPDCETLAKGQLTGAGVPHAHHWYDERYTVYVWKDGRDQKAKVACFNQVYVDKNADALRAKVTKELGVRPTEIVFKDGPPPEQ